MLCRKVISQVKPAKESMQYTESERVPFDAKRERETKEKVISRNAIFSFPPTAHRPKTLPGEAVPCVYLGNRTRGVFKHTDMSPPVEIVLVPVLARVYACHQSLRSQ